MNETSPPVTPETSSSLDAQPQWTSTVYGPVHSWRVGWSLGIDLLFQTSICSFNCMYCQLGDIQQKTAERKIYVETERLEHDLRHSDWEKADIITFSGNGEPTLALNLGECIHLVKEYTHKPVMVLTNATLLSNPEVQRDLMAADIVAVKLDAPNDTLLQRMNRPVPGITFEGIVEGIKAFRHVYPGSENPSGKLALQCMFMPANIEGAWNLAQLIRDIQPDEVQLNTPKRPYPYEWHVSSRGNHGLDQIVRTTSLKTISEPEADWVEKLVREENPNIPIVSIYTRSSKT